jgi:hypothetical protein
MTTQDLFSKVQVSINDPTFTKVQRYEYVQYFKETMAQIALHSGLYLHRELLTMNLGDTDVVVDLPAREPLKLEHVKRGGNVCREFSTVAIHNALADADNRPFSTNDTVLGGRAYSVRLSPNNQGQIILSFAIPFQQDEEVEVVISSTLSDDSMPEEFQDPHFIPIYAFDAYYHGVLSKVMQSLMIRDTREHNNNWQMAEALYDRKKKDLVAYIRKLKSREGLELIQPLLWLSDKGIDHRTGGPGIPPEYTTNII